MRVTVIDNFDSFTFNLVDYLKRLECQVRVYRNNVPAISWRPPTRNCWCFRQALRPLPTLAISSPISSTSTRRCRCLAFALGIRP